MALPPSDVVPPAELESDVTLVGDLLESECLEESDAHGIWECDSCERVDEAAAREVVQQVS